MSTIVRLRDLDSRAWSAAMWAAPFVTQLVLGGVIITSWTFGKWFEGVHGLGVFLVGVAVTTVVSAAAAGFLLTSRSARAHGLAVSIVGSLIVVLIGGTVYGFWIIRW